MTDSHWRRLRVATYNIHRCRGLDGRTNPARIAEVIRTIDADIVALQEVIGAGPTSKGHAEELGALLGMGWVMAPSRHLRGNLFGNVVLSRHPIVHHAHYDLSWKTCEPRCLQRVDVAVGTSRGSCKGAYGMKSVGPGTMVIGSVKRFPARQRGVRAAAAALGA